MGYPELIDALQKECEEKIRKIWEDAEGEAGKIRDEASKRLEKMRAEYDRDLSGAVRNRTEALLSEAASEAKAVRLAAEKELSERLYHAANESLPLLRNNRYGEIFESLAGELPPAEWDVVRVRPEDRDVARRCFPVSRVEEEEGISGGFEVNCGKVRIVNTFEKRLERAWPEMLPGIMKDIYEAAGGR